MTEESSLDMAGHDEPLFVLKYDGDRVGLRVIVLVVFILMLTGPLLFLIPVRDAVDVLAKIFGLLVLFGGVFAIAQTLSFREILLYSERIVQLRKSGDIEIELNNAMLSGFDYHGKKWRSISNQEVVGPTPSIWTISPSNRTITYDESLVAPKDRRQFKGWLAYLSGRKFHFFDEDILPLPEKLIRTAKSPRIVTSTTLDESIFVEDAQTREYRRAEKLACVVIVLSLIMPLLIALLFLFLSR